MFENGTNNIALHTIVNRSTLDEMAVLCLCREEEGRPYVRHVHVPKPPVTKGLPSSAHVAS
ncbi:MAG: hypothetical protein D6741_20675 [Planctomycetota bacterium]|nr:MAG: hypothetical protein D6741_20675 [Planctomycetota bacterium]